MSIATEEIIRTPTSVEVVLRTTPPTKGESIDAMRFPTLHMPTTELRYSVGNI